MEACRSVRAGKICRMIRSSTLAMMVSQRFDQPLKVLDVFSVVTREVINSVVHGSPKSMHNRPQEPGENQTVSIRVAGYRTAETELTKSRCRNFCAPNGLAYLTRDGTDGAVDGVGSEPRRPRWLGGGHGRECRTRTDSRSTNEEMPVV